MNALLYNVNFLTRRSICQFVTMFALVPQKPDRASGNGNAKKKIKNNINCQFHQCNVTTVVDLISDLVPRLKRNLAPCNDCNL